MTRYRKSRYKLWEHPRHREGLRDPGFLNRQSMRDLVRGSIGVVRFEQLKRYFQVSDPTLEKPDDRDWFHRVGPLSSKLRNAFQKYFLPDSKVSIDEMMVRFFGRSKHTIKMKNKPVKQGYKIWALCYQGYTYSFLYYSGVKTIGTAEAPSIHGLSPTSSTVIQLAQSLPYQIHRFDIYMDNLFTNLPLFIALRDNFGIGAAGTTRVNSAGFPDVLKVEKSESKSVLEWGHLSRTVTIGGILALVWQDNSTVFFLSDIHYPSKKVIRKRKRPKSSSTNGPTVRAVFGSSVHKYLPIPRFIDDYNYNMGGVDIVPQLRCYYCIQQKVRRTWYLYFFWLYETTMINIYRMFCILHHLQPKRSTHKHFRIRLARYLLETGVKQLSEAKVKLTFAEPSGPSCEPNPPNLSFPPSQFRSLSKSSPRPQPVQFPAPSTHQIENRPTQRTCLLCRWFQKTKPAGPGSVKVKVTYFGCKECNMALCRDCFSYLHR